MELVKLGVNCTSFSPSKGAWSRQGLGIQHAARGGRDSAPHPSILLLSLDVPIFIFVTSYIITEHFAVTSDYQVYFILPTPVFQMRKLSLRTTEDLTRSHTGQQGLLYVGPGPAPKSGIHHPWLSL